MYRAVMTSQTPTQKEAETVAIIESKQASFIVDGLANEMREELVKGNATLIMITIRYVD